MNHSNWKSELLNTLETERLLPREVISACGRVGEELKRAEIRSRLISLLTLGGLSEREAANRLEQAEKMLRPESLERLMALEFGPGWESEFSPGLAEGRLFLESDRRYVQKWRPLGVIFHIGAGNMDGISGFSALEGLLTGNINLVKLPGTGDPVSAWLAEELIRLEPKLSCFLYLFPIRSDDRKAMEELAAAADAVVVWGGDEAVRAVRQSVSPGTKIVEWGDRLSFAYLPAASINGELDQSLRLLARHIAGTDQLLCSSCQGIFVDTEKGGTLLEVGRRFLKALETEYAARAPKTLEERKRQAAIALELRTGELESLHERKRILRGRHCSVTVYGDSRLEPSLQYGNCWIRPLPASSIVSGLRPYKGKLQTVSVLGIQNLEESAASRLEERLLAAGAVRLTSPAHLSVSYEGEPHDGEFSMRRYAKRVSVQIP